ncbi:hypothetical protein BC936DRAFT_136751 [Jimgerdemannia flammicorona]|uniref:Uncharacterized protein n=1 Tax=Jimgerdemannia flammicorona TaxID=994334 RepID=A0A433DJG2_9FUNG|nr:hypothetical protein BC936DRAFT_136751 [Jimgerdemannia flammicorona]
MLSKQLIDILVRRIEDQKQDVEPRQQRGGKVDVLNGGDARVVPSVHRVGGGKDGSAGVEGGGDTGLGDGDGLLLHDLVDRRAVGLVHLVELVDAADTVVS